MPPRLWRPAAVVCILIGMAGAWMLFRDFDPIFWRIVGGGFAGFVVGMIAMETAWERTVARRGESTPGRSARVADSGETGCSDRTNPPRRPLR